MLITRYRKTCGREAFPISRIRVVGTTLVFLAIFAAIAQLAWTTAADTQGPWFSAAVSSQMYTVSLIGATMLVMFLVALTSSQASAAAREMRALNLRIAILRGSGVGSSPTSGGIDIDRDIEDTLDEILGTVNDGGGSVMVGDREAHDSLVTLTTEGKGVRQETVLREFARARSALAKASWRLWTAVAGPIAMAIGVVAIAGAMLPGSDEFARSYFKLNTALVLFLGYGWPFLLAWATTSLVLAKAREVKT